VPSVRSFISFHLRDLHLSIFHHRIVGRKLVRLAVRAVDVFLLYDVLATLLYVV